MGAIVVAGPVVTTPVVVGALVVAGRLHRGRGCGDWRGMPGVLGGGELFELTLVEEQAAATGALVDQDPVFARRSSCRCCISGT